MKSMNRRMSFTGKEYYGACCLADTLFRDDDVESYGGLRPSAFLYTLSFHSCVLLSISLAHGHNTHTHPYTLFLYVFPKSLASLVNCHRAVWRSAGLVRLLVCCLASTECKPHLNF